MTSLLVHGVTPTDFKQRALPLGRLATPADGDVDLWYLDLSILGHPLQGEPPVRPAQLGARQLRSLRRFYQRLLLGAYLGMPGKDVVISRLVKGKPVLANAPPGRCLDFSISNSGDRCLMGVTASGLLGVDMEQAGRRVGNPVRLARRYFSGEEAGAIEQADEAVRDQVFLHTWACKEAVVKGAGHGIANQLNRFTVSCCQDESPRVVSMKDDRADAWQLALVQPSGENLAAIALRHPRLRIHAYRLMPPG